MKRDDRAEVPTEPPPPPADRASTKQRIGDSRPSGMRATRGHGKGGTAATVDEVVADLSQDPRRERDEDD